MIWFALFNERINKPLSIESPKTITSIACPAFNSLKSTVLPTSLDITKPVNWLLTFTKIFFFSILIIVPEITSQSFGYLISGDSLNNSSNRAKSLFVIYDIKLNNKILTIISDSFFDLS
ncbi:hypothetical protein HOF65_00515 [bacterium]|nr:hypothetical protein [bacterium]MBT3852529.1 hypothetical protein [bacterium]MBT4632694.1 hypothetical protein [bacterium]MBT5491850.1 hypothetical protein [bacterium]MBT6778286.1 hypothetical protein [bacterium]